MTDLSVLEPQTHCLVCGRKLSRYRVATCKACWILLEAFEDECDRQFLKAAADIDSEDS